MPRPDHHRQGMAAEGASGDAGKASFVDELCETGAWALALEFGSLQCRGRCVCVSRKVGKAASAPSLWRLLDARVVYARLGSGGNAFLAGTLLPRVERFALEGANFEMCTRCDDGVLEALGAHSGPTLEHLNLNAVHGASGGALAKLLGRCPRLETLE